jgi:SHS family lactate transporter-like MFS transporter
MHVASETESVSTVLPPPPRWGFAVSAGILGWVLDAFDFFVLVFLLDILSANFHVDKKAIILTITVTLATRPLGALLLGGLADRFGRRRPLILCVVYFTTITALTPFAPNYAIFVLLRALYGMGMGGYWGIGASLVMESSPVRWRGLFSGIMQAGYSLGYLLAAIAMRTVEPGLGWRYMFLAGVPVALLIAAFTLIGPESAAWQKNRLAGTGEIFRTLLRHKKVFGYLVLLMTVMTCLSHGTQDLYPDFLKVSHHFTAAVVSNIAIFYNIGAILGALVIGRFSDRLGRRNGMLLALGIAILSIPAWAFGGTIWVLAFGAFVMQFGVQGVFGVIPAHLNELSPGSVRSLFPGVVYQLGILIGAPSVQIEYALQRTLGYRWALTAFEAGTVLCLILLCVFGPERKGHDLTSAAG